jgi:dipeptidyl aminopeptidase/acylaminoacyl peptidase
MEFMDTISVTDGSMSFSYSPDGRKVAWLRTFPERYQEIIIHDLETGREKMVTSDRKNIEEIVWVRENQIVYTSNKDGIHNVWMVSADGGEPIQITKGTEKISAVKASANGQKILYVKQEYASDFWIVDIAENRRRQVTLTEENQYSPRFSPDGKEIAFIIGAPSEYGVLGDNTHPSHLFVMDRDGKNRRQLTFGDVVTAIPSWSPNGRWIAYVSRKVSEPVDTFRTYIIDPSNPGSPKYIAYGFPGLWLDSVRVQVDALVYNISVDSATPIQVCYDSTEAVVTQGGKYIVFHDRHIGKDLGVWITDGMKPPEVQRKTARLLQWNSRNIKLSGDGKFLYSWRGVGEIWRMALPIGKEERIKADFLGVQNLADFSPSWDEKEIVVVKRKSLEKIVMIENLFK